MTMAEKVLARSSGRDVVRPGEYLTATVDRVMTHEAFTPCALRLIRMGVDRLFDPEKVLVILDHFFPAPNEQMARGHGFADEVEDGDIIVAGRNWGCGSSREQAPENLRMLGVSAVIAESFGRIYFRNCVAMAFPNLACPGVWDACEEGDQLELEVASGLVRNLTRSRQLQGQAYTAEMMEIMERGGLMEVLKDRLGLTS